MYGLLAMALSVPAGFSAKRFGEKRVLAVGLLGVAVGSVLLGEAGSFESALAVPRRHDHRLPLRVRQRARRRGADGAPHAARPHDGRGRRGVVAGVGHRRAARRRARRASSAGAPRSSATPAWPCSARPCSGVLSLPADALTRAATTADGHIVAGAGEPQRLSHARGLDARADRRARRLRPVHGDLLRAERRAGGVRPRRRGGGPHHQHGLSLRDRGESRHRRARGPLQQARRARLRVRHACRGVGIAGDRETC